MSIVESSDIGYNPPNEVKIKAHLQRSHSKPGREAPNNSQFQVKLDLTKEYQRHKTALCMLGLLRDIGFEWDIAFCKFKLFLTFHHIDPSKKEFTISDSNKMTIAWEKILEEVDKCALLCHNCHGEVHAKLIDLENYL